MSVYNGFHETLPLAGSIIGIAFSGQKSIETS